MLKHEDTPHSPPSPAAQVRVTPEELAAAITRLEAKKDAGQRNLEGTVAIGEVVQQLGLDATPEEVLDEVLAGRAQVVPADKRLSSRKRLVLALTAGVAFVGLVAWTTSPKSDNSSAINAMPESPTTYVTALKATPVHITPYPNLGVGDTSGNGFLLSEVGDNQPTHCIYDGNTFQGYSFDAINNGQSWTLIKHDGKVYVRGWIRKTSPKAMRANGIDISTWNSSGFVVPVTLPTDGFKVMPNSGSSVQFHAVDIHTDEHAYEKW